MNKQTTEPKFILNRPLIVDRRKKSARAKFSNEIKHLERHLGRATKRTIKTAAAGLKNFEKTQRKSSSKQRKNYHLHTLTNASGSAAVMMRKVALVPKDLAQAAKTPAARKLVRRVSKINASALSRLITS